MRKDEDFFDKCPHLSQIIPCLLYTSLTAYFGTNYRLLLFFRMSVNPLILFLDDDRGMDVTVRTPVSYTHLDVYKRQQRSSVLKNFRKYKE